MTTVPPAAALVSAAVLAFAVGVTNATLALAHDAAAQNVALNIDAPRLARALIQLSDQTGLQLIYPAGSDKVVDFPARPLSGTYTVKVALDKLLEGSGLKYEFLDDRTIAIVDPARESATAPHGPVTGNHSSAETGEEGLRDSGDGESIQEIVVTAQKRSERLQDVPVPVTVVDASRVAAQGKVLIQDYFTSVPGLSLSALELGSTSLAIRGLTTGGYTAPTVGILIDEVPFGSSLNVPDIDPGDLARIEVLRGPQGTLYGANSLGGLLKFVTKDPSLDAYSGRVEAGSTGTQNGDELGYSLRASANMPLDETLAIGVSGFLRREPGYIDNPVLNLRGVNETRANGARASLLWQPSRNFSAKLGALYQHTKADGSADAYDQAGFGDLENGFIPSVGGYERNVQAYSAELKGNLGAVALTSITGYNITRQSNSLDTTSSLGTFTEMQFGVAGTAAADEIHTKKFTQEVRFLIPLADKLEWLVGGFYGDTKSINFGVYNALDETSGAFVGEWWYYDNPSSMEEYAVFTDLTYRVTDRFDLQFGVRQGHTNNRTGTAYSRGLFNTVLFGLPTLETTAPGYGTSGDALTYLFTPRFRFSEDVMVYARLASGFRPGGSNPPNLPVPTRYDADKTYNYELGVKADILDHALSLDASAYYIDWQGIPVNVRSPLGFSYISNGGKAKSEGVELAITSRPLSGLTAASWIAYSNARLTEDLPAVDLVGLDGDRLPNSSRWSGNISLEQVFPLWNEAEGFVGGELSYVGKRQGVFTNVGARQTFPDYTKIDLRAGVRYASWTASAFITNVSDERGVLNGGIGFYYPTAFLYIRPRTMGVSLAKTF